MANLDETNNFDAEQLSEDIAKGEEKQPKVNVESDYELSKEFAVADIDKTEAGDKAAHEATAPKFEVPEAKEMRSEPTESDADPDQYRDMAKEVNPRL
ncbi:hypothetical protein IFO70_06130 [Phormidium tenue FACHB-886]|nr:hypothetical protein [Phormidium tenue FACHB-886]